MRFDLHTVASPEQVRRALTDFSERRPEIWHRTLDPRTYELRDHGDTWAVARESTSRSPFWVVCRYDWSDPAVVRWTTEESSYGGKGDGLVRIDAAENGGSHVRAEWTYTDVRLRDRPVLFLMNRAMGRPIARMWASTLDRYARSDGG